jgi:predicted NUDIX family NTP pyrophosphohydrolase
VGTLERSANGSPVYLVLDAGLVAERPVHVGKTVRMRRDRLRSPHLCPCPEPLIQDAGSHSSEGWHRALVSSSTAKDRPGWRCSSYIRVDPSGSAAWSIPKGEHEDYEHGLAAALREFHEETGMEAPQADWISLGTVRQRGGKTVAAWAGAGDLDPRAIHSSTFELEWPPGSGRRVDFPEVDRAAWFDLRAARRSILASQRPFVDRLLMLLDAEGR